MTSFEEEIQRLEEIVKILDRGDEAIAVLLELYEEGMGLVVKCRSYLQTTEQKVTLINQDNALNTL
jgi:exodeoxyribonuclease VII small subunit